MEAPYLPILWQSPVQSPVEMRTAVGVAGSTSPVLSPRGSFVPGTKNPGTARTAGGSGLDRGRARPRSFILLDFRTPFRAFGSCRTPNGTRPPRRANVGEWAGGGDTGLPAPEKATQGRTGGNGGTRRPVHPGGWTIPCRYACITA